MCRTAFSSVVDAPEPSSRASPARRTTSPSSGYSASSASSSSSIAAAASAIAPRRDGRARRLGERRRRIFLLTIWPYVNRPIKAKSVEFCRIRKTKPRGGRRARRAESQCHALTPRPLRRLYTLCLAERSSVRGLDASSQVTPIVRARVVIRGEQDGHVRHRRRRRKPRGHPRAPRARGPNPAGGRARSACARTDPAEDSTSPPRCASTPVPRVIPAAARAPRSYVSPLGFYVPLDPSPLRASSSPPRAHATLTRSLVARLLLAFARRTSRR